MAKFSYSKVQTFNQCPFKYRLTYIDHLEPKDDLSPDNPLFVGTAAHEGVEQRSVEAAIENYKANFPEVGPEHEFEIEKLKTILPKAIEQIPECVEYEHKLEDEDGFVGYIDGLVKNEDGTYDILDFKCSNSVASYKKSGQVHLYKYYYEKLTGNKVRALYYVFIPKPTIKLEEGLTTKQQVLENLAAKDIIFEKVNYDQNQVNYFFARKRLMENAKTFERHPNAFCRWCPFYKLCTTNGVDRSELKEYNSSTSEV